MAPDSEDRSSLPEPPPIPREASGDFKALEEARRGFVVMPTQTAEPVDFSRPMGGMPPPEPVDTATLPTPPPAPSDSE